MRRGGGLLVLVLALEDADEGMVLAAPVPQPGHPGVDLCKRGVRLDRDTLARLHELGVTHVCVEFAPLKDLDRHTNVLSSAPRIALDRLVREAFETCQRKADNEPNYAQLYQCSRDLIAEVAAVGQRGVYFDPGGRNGMDLAGHSVGVTHLAVLLGIRLERYLIQQRSRLPSHHAKEVVNLSVAAMLHDIGKTRIDPALRQFHAASKPEDSATGEVWQSHTRIGYEMIKGSVEASAASAVLHHHQLFDGSGFPKLTVGGKPVTWEGRRLHVFARILAVANAFDRLCVRKDTTQRWSNIEALHALREKFAGKFDGVVVKTLHQACPPFPPGTTVTLEDGSTAVVVHVDDGNVYRPVLRKLGPPADRSVLPQLVGEAIDLRRDPTIQIIRAGGINTEGLLTTAEAIDAIANSSTDPEGLEDSRALKGEAAERAYTRPPGPIRPVVTYKANRAGRVGGLERGVEEIAEPDLDTPPMGEKSAA